MKIPARRYQLALLFSLLVLSGFTIYAHKALEAPSNSSTDPSGRARQARRAQQTMTQPAKPGGQAATGKFANQPNGVIVTATSAAALTNDLFAGDTELFGEGIFEPLQSGGSFDISPSIVAGGGGGGPSTGGNNGVTGSVGQSALGTASGGNFSISSGFWGGAAGGGCPTIVINPLSLPSGQLAQPYSQQLTQVGGTGAITWSISAGSLPNNLTLNSSTGLLSGTPVVSGQFNFTVKATDATNCMGTQAYSLVISSCGGAITVNPTTIPAGTLATPYSQQFTQAGGTGTITWSVSAGSLPANLLLNSSTGLLSGTPVVTGTFNFTIQAMDGNSCIGTRAYSLVINAVSNPGLQFYSLAHPVRLLDTRQGLTGCYTPNAAIPGGTSRTQPARGICDSLNIPADAMAITGNITTVQSGGGYLTLYPSDAAQPVVANSNYNPNEIVNNVFTVGLGNADGAFKIFVTSTTDIVIDVTGYYAPPAAGGLYFHPLPKPIRLLETRAGFTGCNAPGVPLPGGVDTPQLARLTCDGVTIPNTASAIVGNATTVNPQGPGFPYLTLFPADAARPLVASSNYLPGQIMNAPFTVGLSSAGEFKIYPTTQTDMVIDVLGYYSTDASDVNGTGLLFNSLPHPVRLLETRAGFAGCYATNSPLASGSTRTQPARGVCDGVTIAAGALGIVGNATVVNTSGGYLTFWPSSAVQPLVASSNFAAGQVFNRHFTVGLGAGDGAFKIFTQFQTDLVIDVSGFFAP